MRIAIIGAGIGGLVCAVSLALEGHEIDVFEKENGPGGKARRLPVGQSMVDAGPTVFTMRDVFDQLFERAGERLENQVTLSQAEVLARHAWDDKAQLDLFADQQRSEEAIGAFAGAKAAVEFRSFSADAARAYTVLEDTFMRATKPATPLALSWRIGPMRVADQLAIRPFSSLWNVIGNHFSDPRLQQLFGRYATYCGSSPFEAPGTLSLIAHLEQRGVWLIEGGIHALALALQRIGEKHGVRFHFNSSVDSIRATGDNLEGVVLANGDLAACDHIVSNCDPDALARGRFGKDAARAVRATPERERSLSALVWLAEAETDGFPLSHHNVIFSPDYIAEFQDIAESKPPSDPSIYVCALDREAVPGVQSSSGRERLQIIVNAPANGDTHKYSSEETEQCTEAMMRSAQRCGLKLERPLPHELLTPNAFEQLSPSTGGAIYGRASHGWAASFRRQGARTKIPWLYCAGGATHPGAGVPMAALSGLQAARSLMEDRASTPKFHPVATAGGTSMRSAKTASTR
ncbi:1-hydroxycarotenoid 3,4-desaturase CrtD [Altererythrobacter lutimaris]|uniref:Phytoene desaturase n=1 Tax=Altererythrobacter lutimaris TaxID=2743979 RepID=A0A850H743_9SPHN|nr:phytoene desaturase [Altererythrobacter lutimaris]